MYCAGTWLCGVAQSKKDKVCASTEEEEEEDGLRSGFAGCWNLVKAGFVAWCAGLLDSDGQSITFSEPRPVLVAPFKCSGSPGHPVRGLQSIRGVGPIGDLGPRQAPEA